MSEEDDTDEFKLVIHDDEALLHDLEERFGADLMNQLAAQWREPDVTRSLFRAWHKAVTEPIGVPAKTAGELFTGIITIEEFVETLDDHLLDAFVEQFPQLQAAFQATLENQAVWQ